MKERASVELEIVKEAKGNYRVGRSMENMLFRPRQFLKQNLLISDAFQINTGQSITMKILVLVFCIQDNIQYI